MLEVETIAKIRRAYFVRASTSVSAFRPHSITLRSRPARRLALADKRDELRAKGVEVTDIVDHGWSQSIYFKDPNNLSLEYCCLTRNFTEDDATMQERFTIRRAALDFGDATAPKSPRHNRVTSDARLERAPAARAMGAGRSGSGRRFRPGLAGRPWSPQADDHGFPGCGCYPDDCETVET
jgi:hypothetical protein